MKDSNQIRYITGEEVDREKWDNCIDVAENGLIYGYSVYLDQMSVRWDALVLNDYQAVMPLTWNKKYGFYYLYQPFLSASLGIFGSHIDARTVENFLRAIPRRFRLWEISLNHGNLFSIPSFNLLQRTNFILPLQAGYANLYEGFRDNVKRNIKKSAAIGNCNDKNFDVEEVIALASDQMQKFSKIRPADFDRFRTLYEILKPGGKAVTYGIRSKDGQLLSSAVFLYSHHRAYYILVGNHPNGKTLGAGHALINSFIRDHAGQPLLLDFEGSDIGNIAFFYSSFGAKEEKYPALSYNRLPPLVRWLREGRV